MSDELEQRLAHAQHELSQVREELEGLKAQLDAPDSALVKLQARVEKTANERAARQEAVDELEREVKQLRAEAHRVAEAVLNP